MRLASGAPNFACQAGPGKPAAHRANHLATQALPLGLGARVQQRGAPREVVEHQKRARRDVMRVGAVVDRRGARRQALEVAHQVVARDTDEPAVQRKAVAVRFGTRRPRERCAQRAEQGGLVGGPRLQLGSRCAIRRRRAAARGSRRNR